MSEHNGEFKKKMGFYHFNDEEILRSVATNPQIPLLQYSHGYVKGFEEAQNIFFEMIDEARKEFGKDYDGFPILNTPREIYSMWSINPSSEEMIAFSEAVLKWFKKWFGDV